MKKQNLFHRLAENLVIPSKKGDKPVSANMISRLLSGEAPLAPEECLIWTGCLSMKQPKVIKGTHRFPEPIIQIAGRRYRVARLMVQMPDKDMNLRRPLQSVQIPNSPKRTYLERITRNRELCPNHLCVNPNHWDIKPMVDHKGHAIYYLEEEVRLKQIDEVEDLIEILEGVYDQNFENIESLRSFVGEDFSEYEYREALVRGDFPAWEHLL